MDLSPKYITISADQEIVLPSNVQDTPGQIVGGFSSTPAELTQGKIRIQGVDERILIGDASLPLTGAGLFMGWDGGVVKNYDFRVGDPAGSYIYWDGSASTLTIVGTITATSGTIGGFSIGSNYIKDVADSFGLSSVVTAGDDVRFWAGDTFANRATAPFRVTEAGAVTASNINITGGTIASSTLNMAIKTATSNLVFTSTDNDTISWGSGTITLLDGTNYSISAGNTGNMSALSYIYLDIAVSVTVLQVTTTYSTAVGEGKILVASAQNATSGGAFCIPYLGGTPLINGNTQINASSILAGQISVSQLSAITADLGTITAGSITINGGVASIDASGNAVFKSIQVGGGTKQYTITNDGIFSFGDGSDGSLSTSGNVTLTSDKYYTNLTINTGHVFDPAGYRIFVNGTLTVNGTISRNGNAGGDGGDATDYYISGGVAVYGGGVGAAGTAGAGLADGYLKGSVAGKAGSAGGQGGRPGGGAGGGGGAGDATSNSIGSSGIIGGAGGAGGSGYSGAGGAAGGGGAAGVATVSNVKLIANWHLATLLDIGSTGSTIKYNNSGGSGGGGAGGGGTADLRSNLAYGGDGGGGGGSGSPGAIIAIYAKIIVIGASGVISSNGGNGGNGGDGAAGTSNEVFYYTGGGAGGGGGSGGNGGQLILVYNSLTNGGSIVANGGTKGTKGTGHAGINGGGTGADGVDGSDGAAGTIRYFQISL